MKKNILVIAPIMPQRSEIESFANTLAFLLPHYNLNVIDPLEIIDISLKNHDYYLAWQHYLSHPHQPYDALIGFSFGGVILQQCFSLFEHQPIPIILFSTPSFADQTLIQTLQQVISLCENNQLEQALDVLYTAVYHPNPSRLQRLKTLNPTEAADRLINGLNRILATNATRLLKTNTVPHLHFIGEQSNLVNFQNVVAPNVGKLLRVPQAGMRVLEDNLLFCQPIMMNELGCGNE